ncbi:hypothetical protein C7N43_26635 [Sphingobacteriales bacterium UPWRP_1]|nr:hypothetical protein B6N25_04170 [Sphingobacteriales bacterium TSM_CSS]PSJ73937.1 hypothetical protein C7N43_26635 [Sphingobacteriales bacterium UPWRP_1]
MKVIDALFDFFAPNAKEPDVKFGRYSDSYKTDLQHQSLDNATHEYEKGNYLEAYRHFFTYLCDEKEDNVHFEVTGNEIHFSLLQGSKRISGVAGTGKIWAETAMAKAKSLNVSLMRKLMEMNYALRYCRYALHNDIIYLKFNTGILDGSPQKLYFALKEMAISADRQDDTLLNEFSNLEAIDSSHIRQMPDEEKSVKYSFFRKWTEETLQEVRRLDPNIFSRGISYLLLNLAYKTDYLIVPHGTVMDAIERVHILYFNENEDAAIVEKNAAMIREFEKMLAILPDEFNRQLYCTQTTFGITNFATPGQVADIIYELLQDAKEYKRRKQLTIAHGVVEYIMHYCLFHYGMPQCIRELLHVGIRVLNGTYFEALGFTEQFFNPNTNSFDKPAIKHCVSAIGKRALKDYPLFDFDVKNLDYRSATDFVYSLLLEIANCNYNDR